MTGIPGLWLLLILYTVTPVPRDDEDWHLSKAYSFGSEAECYAALQSGQFVGEIKLAKKVMMSCIPAGRRV